MIKPEVLDAMVAAGCTAEQIAAAVKADQRTSTGAARQARYRARKASQSDERDVTTVTVTDTVSPKKEIPPTPPKEKITPSSFSVGSAREFDQFWSLFPNKVGKRDAEKAFDKALQRASFDTIMAGLRRYVAKTDDRPWCNPATFLNQDRWADEPSSVPARPHSTASPPVQDFNSIFDAMQGKPNAAHTGPVIDASDERADRSGFAGVVQLHALQTRR